MKSFYIDYPAIHYFAFLFIVGNEYNRFAFALLLCIEHDFFLCFQIQSLEWFVQKQNIIFSHERPQDRHTPPLSTAHAAGRLFCEIGCQTHNGHGFNDVIRFYRLMAHKPDIGRSA